MRLGTFGRAVILLPWLLSTSLVGGCQQAKPATQVVVSVHTNLKLGEELDALEVRLLDAEELGNDVPPAHVFALSADPGEGEHEMPLSFSLGTKDPGSRESFRLVLTGLYEGTPVVEHQAIASFVPHVSTHLEVLLGRDCLGILCAGEGGSRTNRSCSLDDGQCHTVVAVGPLSEWQGTGSELDPSAGEQILYEPAVSCDAGMEKAGATCVDIDECARGTHDCDPHADCTNTQGGFECTCRADDGYAGDGFSCENLDECSDAALHDCDSSPFACVDRAPSAGKYECVCPQGFEGNGLGEQGCQDVNECQASDSPCDDAPQAHCDNLEGSFQCVCPQGFAGTGRGALGCMPLPEDIAFDFGTLVPAYDPEVLEYELDVGNWQSSVGIEVLLAEGPELTLDGERFSRNILASHALEIGDNELHFTVTQGAISRTYTVTITRGAPVEHYLENPVPSEFDWFGSDVALSADGRTLAIGVPEEDSSTVGVGTVANEEARDAGAVFVYYYDGTAWRPQAYLKASNTDEGDQFGGALAMSADGNLLAVGAPTEDTDPGAPMPNEDARDSGAVYVFERDGSAWAQSAYVKFPATGAYDLFGGSLALSADGQVLAVGLTGDDHDGSPVVSAPNDNLSGSGAVFMYGRTGESWEPLEYLKASNPGEGDRFGTSLALSRDGQILAVGATGEDSTSTGVNSTPNDDGQETGAVYLYHRNGSWREVAYLKPSRTGDLDRFGSSLSLSGDGMTLAVGAPSEDTDPNDPIVPNDNLQASGAAYVFVPGEDQWVQEAYLKASDTHAAQAFGASVALSEDGTALAVGALSDPWNGNAEPGATYVLRRTGSGWSEQSRIEPGAPGPGDFFGKAVALSADAEVLAVGASGRSPLIQVSGWRDPHPWGAYLGAVFVYQAP